MLNEALKMTYVAFCEDTRVPFSKSNGGLMVSISWVLDAN